MIEELVQFLVGEVDTQLFKGVDLEVFESKDVKNADEFLGIFSRICCLIDS